MNLLRVRPSYRLKFSLFPDKALTINCQRKEFESNVLGVFIYSEAFDMQSIALLATNVQYYSLFGVLCQ